MLLALPTILLALIPLALFALFDGEDGGGGSSSDDDTVRLTDDLLPTGPEIPDDRGDDVITLGSDDDVFTMPVDGGTLNAGLGHDTITGSAEADAINGQGGADDIRAGAGDDTSDGGSGDDVLIDKAGENTLFGGGGDDFIAALDSDGGNADMVAGGTGDDALFLDDGDTATGGEGQDRFNVMALTRSADEMAPDPVTITDFNPAEDSLYLLTNDTDSGLQIVTTEQDSIISFGDTVVAVLSGVTAEASSLNVFIENVDDDFAVEDRIPVGPNTPTPVTNLTEDDDTSNNRDSETAVSLQGLAGKDTITGSMFDDTLAGGAGNDDITDAQGDDVLNGEGGKDILNGGSGDDVLNGGASSDILLDAHGADTLNGGTGGDLLVALDKSSAYEAGVLNAGAGDDLLFGDSGDTLTGGSGDDIFLIMIDPTQTDPVIVTDFNLEQDSALFQSKGAALTLDATLGEDGQSTVFSLDGKAVAIINGLIPTQATGTTVKTTQLPDDFDPFKAIRAAEDLTSENDIFDGSDTFLDQVVKGLDGDDVITTGEGDDRVNGGNGNDTIVTAQGNDTIFAGAGSDTVSAGNDDDTVFLGSGKDTYSGGELGDDRVVGGSGDDEIVDSRGSNILEGGTGNDFIFARDVGEEGGPAQTDIVLGGFGNDTMLIDNGDTASGGAGADSFNIRADSGDANVIITDFNNAEDVVVVLVAPELVPTPTGMDDPDPKTLWVAADSDAGATITYNGQLVAVLQGAQAADLNDTNVKIRLAGV